MDDEKNPTPNSPAAIAAAWDHLCDVYTDDLTTLNKRKALAAVELAVIRRELAGPDGLRILDAGCGPGWHGLELARDGHNVVMADLSEKMLAKVRIAAETAQVKDRITICQGDIRSLTLESSSFDAIISCGTVVSDCGDADVALAQFSKLLKTGGLALFSVRNLLAFLDRKCKNADPHHVQQWINSGRRLIPQGHQAFDWVLFTVKGVRDACSAAGMELQRVYPVGVVSPPQNDKDVLSYVQFHINLVDQDAALTKSHELFAVANKP